MKHTNFEQYKRMIRFFTVLVLVIFMTIIFVLLWDKYYNEGIIFPFYFKGYWLMGAFYAFFFTMFSYVLGGMKVGYLQNGNLILSQVIAVIGANVSIYLETVLLSAKFVDILPIILLTIIDSIGIVLWSIVAGSIFKKLFPPRDVLLLYDKYDPAPLFQKVMTRRDRYKIRKSICVDTDFENAVGEIKKFDAVFLCDIQSTMRNQILKYCYAMKKRVYITPKISDIMIKSAENIHLFDTPLLLLRNQGLKFEEICLKRIMDIIISVTALIITAPITLIVAILIKLTDGGPVFFRQDRCTLNGKLFSIHKFRSMVVDAEKDGEVIPTTEDDERITPIGRFIRRTRIDELPQFIDILLGDMSVVGPRPERVEHVNQYTEEIPEFSYRLKVKGGLTGYAQIYGKYNTTAYDKLKLDLMYIQNYSILLDIKIIIMTFKIVFMRESTEGFDQK